VYLWKTFFLDVDEMGGAGGRATIVQLPSSIGESAKAVALKRDRGLREEEERAAAEKRLLEVESALRAATAETQTLSRQVKQLLEKMNGR